MNELDSFSALIDCISKQIDKLTLTLGRAAKASTWEFFSCFLFGLIVSSNGDADPLLRLTDPVDELTDDVSNKRKKIELLNAFDAKWKQTIEP